MDQLQGNPSSLMSLGPGRQMAVATCVLAALWFAAALGLAWRYRTRGYAPAQESVWLRYLPRVIRAQLPA
jgi:preprotein translocase subunit SecG